MHDAKSLQFWNRGQAGILGLHYLDLLFLRFSLDGPEGVDQILVTLPMEGLLTPCNDMILEYLEGNGKLQSDDVK